MFVWGGGGGEVIVAVKGHGYIFFFSFFCFYFLSFTFIGAQLECRGFLVFGLIILPLKRKRVKKDHRQRYPTHRTFNFPSDTFLPELIPSWEFSPPDNSSPLPPFIGHTLL